MDIEITGSTNDQTPFSIQFGKSVTEKQKLPKPPLPSPPADRNS